MDKTKDNNSKKVFLVFNTACFGDVLLCNSLVQNIKNAFSDVKVVFVCDKKFKDVALYQKDVDDVIVFDKNGEHKGLFGILKFIKGFKYKNAFASIITYHNERNYIISKLLGCKKIIMSTQEKDCSYSVQEKHNLLLQKLSDKEIINYPIKFNVPNSYLESIYNLFPAKEPYIVLCATSKKQEKDIPVDVCSDLIKMFNNHGTNVVFTGAGEKSLRYSEELKKSGCNFINLVNQTTIPELAAVIKNSRLLISVDTGTMHLGTAIGISVLAVWYEKCTENFWMPSDKLYKITFVKDEQTAERIFDSAIESLGKA